MTRDAFAVPLRLELVVRPLSELRLAFGAHNRFIALDDRGRIIDRTPWFLKSAAQRGEAVAIEGAFLDGDWARVTFEFGDHERRLHVNGELRHVWREDYAGLRTRTGIGVQRSAITIRELTVLPRLPAASRREP
jgi:hypothetical protein